MPWNGAELGSVNESEGPSLGDIEKEVVGFMRLRLSACNASRIMLT